jgi:hypothetical protein
MGFQSFEKRAEEQHDDESTAKTPQREYEESLPRS